MIKIVYFYLGQQGGGAAIDALEMAIGLSHYAEVMCVVSSTSDSYFRWLAESSENLHFQVLGVKTSKSIITGSLQMLNLIRNVRIVSHIRQFKPDVVFSYMGHPYERVIIPHIKCKIKAKGIHDVKTHEGDESILLSIISRLTSYKETHCVVFSEFSCRELEKKGVPGNRIITTFLGCTSKLIKNRNLDLTFYNQFLFFGRLIKYKGIDVLFHSLEKVFQECPNSKLVIAGRGDISEYKPFIDRYKNNLDIHNEWIEDYDIYRYYQNVDFVVAPYTDATQSGVVPLSNSFGKPVIVSNSGGLPEQVKEGITGLIVPSGDSGALAEAIIRMMRDKNDLSEMKRQAYDFSFELSFEASAKKLYSQFVEILDKKELA